MPTDANVDARDVNSNRPLRDGGTYGLSASGRSALSKTRSQPAVRLQPPVDCGECLVVLRLDGRQPKFLRHLHQSRADLGIRLGANPEDRLVLLSVAVAVLYGGLGLADTAESGDRLTDDGTTVDGEGGVEVGEDVLAAGEVGVAPRDVPGDLLGLAFLWRQLEELSPYVCSLFDQFVEFATGPKVAGILGTPGFPRGVPGPNRDRTGHHKDKLVGVLVLGQRPQLPDLFLCSFGAELFDTFALEDNAAVPAPCSDVTALLAAGLAQVLYSLVTSALNQPKAQAFEVSR